MANDENLNRGKQPGKKLQPGAENVIGKGVPLHELRKRELAGDEEVRQKMREDPMEVFESLAENLAVLSHKLLKSAVRAKVGTMPDRALMDTLRELRQTIERVVEYRAIRGAAAQADEWFAEVEARMESLEAVMEEGLKPAVAIPA